MNQFRGVSPHGTRDLLHTHSLAYAATIQLHKNFISSNASSNPKCLAAASAVVTILDNVNLSGLAFINPIMGVRSLILPLNKCDSNSSLQIVLMITCHVFIDEILRIRSHHNNRAPVVSVGNEARLKASIQSVIATMAVFGSNCSIIG